MIKVRMLEYPIDVDWVEVKRRASITVDKYDANTKLPSVRWREKILRARHSPIRYIRFSFYIECPYWVSVHLSRHVHAQPYIQTQRNDRQDKYDRDAARQDETVRMIWDLNAEELMVVANKRLCNKAAQETREVVEEMCRLVVKECPEFESVLVPMCTYHGGVCHEFNSCLSEVSRYADCRK